MGKNRLIINPTAGRGKPERYLQLIREKLERYHVDHDVFITDGSGTATVGAREAAERGYDCVIAAGGDGTVHEVVNGLAGSQTAMAILPLGTENVLAKELHLPFNLDAAVRFVAGNPPVSIDLGKVGSVYFVLMAGIGFDAQVVRDLDPHFKRQFSRLSFLVTGIATLSRFHPSPIEIRVNGSRIQTTAWEVLVSNASIFAGRVRVSPDASIRDGRFDVCIFSGEHRTAFFGDVLQAAMFRRFAGEGVQTLQAAHVCIFSDRTLPVQLDGEVTELNSLDFEIQANALPVIGLPSLQSPTNGARLTDE